LFVASDHSTLQAVAEDSTPKEPEQPVLLDGYTAEDEKAIEETKESFVFQAEVSRLMDIIINSLCKKILF
jgi:hypothetical protein